MAQKNRAAAEAFQFACTLAGYGTSLRERKPTKNRAAVMWEVNYRKQRHFLPYRLARESRVAYDGEVWCPRTLNQSWLARRNGSVYFTGNTFLACQHGFVFEGRGTGTGSAANGTTQGNLDYYAVCALIGPTDKPTPALLTGIGQGIDACRAAGAGARVLGHRDLFPTAVPGEALYALVRAGRWGAATPPVPPGVPPRPSGPAKLVVGGAFGPATKRRLQQWAGVPQDGVLGPVSWRAIQRRVGAPADGIPGPVTWKAIQRLVGAPADGILGPVTYAALQRYLNSH